MDTSNLFDNAVEHWRLNKGIGTAFIPTSINAKCMVYSILQRFYAKSTPTTLIIVPTFNIRNELVEFLTHQDSEENNKEFKDLMNDKTIRIYTFDFVENNVCNMYPFVSIMYKCDTVGDNVFLTFKRAKFRLAILDKIFDNINDLNKLYEIAPLLPDFRQNELDAIRASTPVEEMICGIDIPEDNEDFKLLTYYNDYITGSLNIFGSFDMLEKARTGDNQLNISSMQICYQLAYENGWKEDLDMNQYFNIELDKTYNPGAIKDRAIQTYEIIRNRSQFLSDYRGKLDKVLELVNEHKDEKILIISKRGEFASQITDYINNLSEKTICGNYHDKAEPIPALDGKGNVIVYKSGPKKGEPRYLASQAQKTLNEKLFNQGVINVLSTNNSPDKTLSIEIDTVIITSPMCESIESFIYRLNNVFFKNSKINLYTLYIKQSLEETKLKNKPATATHTIINDELNINFDKNNFIINADN